ncbi:MAG TPA: acylphosphatase [Hanamia sp.]|nr:acylphosphatase [Hanamia sp.]
METVHLLISGKVQGVFFRDSSKKIAQRLNITGWIKNRQDDKVEAMISGEEKNLNAFIDWCKSGPERAKVEEVIVSTKEKIYFEKFEIKKH